MHKQFLFGCKMQHYKPLGEGRKTRSLKPLAFLPFTLKIFRQPIPENLWLYPKKNCGCPYEKIYIYISIYPKKLQFAAYGQFVLVCIHYVIYIMIKVYRSNIASVLIRGRMQDQEVISGKLIPSPQILKVPKFGKNAYFCHIFPLFPHLNTPQVLIWQKTGVKF